VVTPHPQNTAPAHAPTGQDGDATEPSWPLTTWQGWHRFATTDPPTPPQPGQAPRSLEEAVATSPSSQRDTAHGHG
jgi:hypothetical protein